MKMKLINAFTPGMLAQFPATVSFRELTEEEARRLAADGLESAVGHQGTAEVFGHRLGITVPMNRVSVTLQPGESALLGQYVGPRLPEGRVLTAEELASAGVRWLLVTVGRAA